MLISDAKRKEIESLIYKVYDTADPSKINSNYYMGIFSKMNNDEFYHFLERRLPFRFHQDAFKSEPKVPDMIEAFKVLKKPLFEKVNLRHVYINKDGTPVESKECLVVYIHIKRLKQMISKKNNSSMDIEMRDMKTGLLMQQDRAGRESDREFESLASYGLDYTMDEFRTIKADAMKASQEMLQTIANKGSVSEKDYVITRQDSLARNMLNAYLIGANIHSNLVDDDYFNPHTVSKRKSGTGIERI